MTTIPSLLATVSEIILDYQSVAINPGVPRSLNIVPLPGKASVCMGVRRSGKSTYMAQIIRYLLEDGILRQNILYLNFFDDRLHTLNDLNIVLEAYFLLYPEKKNTEKIYCFFDEIQVIPGWEPFIERLIRTELCQVYITGSSAHMLSKEIATQMRGRALAWEMFPFSFREFLVFKKIEGQGPFSTKSRLLIQKAFEEYWESGGFPEVLGLDRFLRVKIHQEYFSAIMFRDLIERHDISHPKAILDLAHYLIDNIASLYSVNKLTGYLKSLSHHVPKTSVSEYIDWFEDAYILFSVKIFDPSHARTNANPKKIYCIDHALVRSVGSGILVNAGHLLESLVYITLRKMTDSIFYYKTRMGLEVDFIIQTVDRTRLLVQVCETMVDSQTRKREISALTEAMRELNLNIAYIVTRHEEDEYLFEMGKIVVIPVWRFLLDFDLGA